MKNNPIKPDMEEDGSSFEELIEVLMAEPPSQSNDPLDLGVGNSSQGSADGGKEKKQ